MPGLFHTPPLLLVLEEDDEEEEEELDDPPLDDDDVLDPPLEEEVLGGGGGGGRAPVLGGVVDVSPDEPFAGSVGSENCELPGGPKSSDCDAPLHAIRTTVERRATRFFMADELYPPRRPCPMPCAHPFRLFVERARSSVTRTGTDAVPKGVLHALFGSCAAC
jgi:hypothetical protein